MPFSRSFTSLCTTACLQQGSTEAQDNRKKYTMYVFAGLCCIVTLFEFGFCSNFEILAALMLLYLSRTASSKHAPALSLGCGAQCRLSTAVCATAGSRVDSPVLKPESFLQPATLVGQDLQALLMASVL